MLQVGAQPSSSLSCHRSSQYTTRSVLTDAAGARHTVANTFRVLRKRVGFTPLRVRIPNPPPLASREAPPDLTVPSIRGGGSPKHSWRWQWLLRLFLLPYHVTGESLVGEQRRDRDPEFYQVVERVPEFFCRSRDGNSTKRGHLRRGREVRGRP